MKKLILTIGWGILLALMSCNNNQSTSPADAAAAAQTKFGGFNSQAEWGKHLVKAIGCAECHTPKRNMVPVDSLALSGFHAGISEVPDFHRAEIEKNGYILGNSDWTAFEGPWGISYAANLTSDATGIGNWDEHNFLVAIELGKYMGLDNSRQLLPPMPWHDFANFSEDELKAIFAYLKTTNPVHNIVPSPTAPLSGKK